MSDFIPSTKWRMSITGWVLLSLVLFFGITSSVLTFVYVITRPQQVVEGLKAPGEQSFDLKSSGYHVIYFAFQRTHDHKGVVRPDGYTQLQINVVGEDGKKLALEAIPDKYTYVWRYIHGYSAYGFNAEKAGTYRLLTEFPDDVETQEINLVVKRVYKNLMRDAFLAELVVILITICTAVAVAKFGRYQYQKSDEAAYYNALREGAA